MIVTGFSGAMKVAVMHSTVLPGDGPVVLGEVYKVDCKRHGAHCQDVDNSEG